MSDYLLISYIVIKKQLTQTWTVAGGDHGAADPDGNPAHTRRQSGRHTGRRRRIWQHAQHPRHRTGTATGTITELENIYFLIFCRLTPRSKGPLGIKIRY